MNELRRLARNVMLDTNIYGWVLAYMVGDERESAINSYSLYNRLFQEKGKRESLYSVLSCQKIIEEIEDSKIIDIKTLHDSLCDKIIYRSKPVEKLREKYFKEFNIRRFPITVEDCEIVSSATLGNSSFLVTENRRTLSNPIAIEVYRKVNKKEKFKSPKIVSTEEALTKMFSF